MTRILAIALGALLLCIGAAMAQVSLIDDSSTVGTSSAPCVAAIGAAFANGQSGTRPGGGGSLTLSNAGTNVIWYNPTGGVAAANAAGSIELAVGALDYWPAGSAPKGAMNCIAVGGSSVLTVSYGVE